MSGFDDEWDGRDGERPPRRRPRRHAQPRQPRSATEETPPEGTRREGQSELVRLAGERKAGARKYDRLPPEHQDDIEDMRRSDVPETHVHGRHDDYEDWEDDLPEASSALDRSAGSSTYSVKRGAYPPPTPMIEARYEEEEPLLDVRTFIRAIYESRFIILGAMLVCMVLLAGATTLLPKKYTASANLYFDPTKLQLSWDGQATNPVNPQTMTSLVNSQIAILSSSTLLQQVVRNLDLAKGSDMENEQSVLLAAAQLSRDVSVGRVDDSFVIGVNVTTGDPERSALIANEIVDSFYKYEVTTASDQYKTVTSTLDKRLEDLRQKAFTAEKAVQDYRARNDLVSAGGSLISDDRLTALNTALVQAQQQTIEARARVEAASRLSVSSAVTGGATEVASPELSQLRRQYTTASADLSRLQSQLGSRHPAIAEAEASLGTIRTEIGQELKRILSAAQTQLSQAQKAQDEIAKELTAQKALKLSNSPNQAALDNLELQAETARAIYEAMLTRTRQANEEYNNLQSNIRVIGRAEPPILADGPGRMMLLTGGAIGGAIAGFGIGLLFALLRQLAGNPRVRSYFTFTDEASAGRQA
ncbi:sugar transporter [Rhodobacterales bacterium]|nr:sugar transporter [Rhodobacterales bacterium]